MFMEDKRVAKTKIRLKMTLVALLQDEPFEKITVTEICEIGMISRITFYIHYEDKYDLLNDLFSDYITDATKYYKSLQEHSNSQNILIGYENLMNAILYMFYNNINFFSQTDSQKNPYLFSEFYNNVFEVVRKYFIDHKELQLKYPVNQTVSFLCHGFFGVINSCNTDIICQEETYKLVRQMYCDILSSALFLTKQN